MPTSLWMPGVIAPFAPPSVRHWVWWATVLNHVWASQATLSTASKLKNKQNVL